MYFSPFFQYLCAPTYPHWFDLYDQVGYYCLGWNHLSGNLAFLLFILANPLLLLDILVKDFRFARSEVGLSTSLVFLNIPSQVLCFIFVALFILQDILKNDWLIHLPVPGVKISDSNQEWKETSRPRDACCQ